MTKGKIQKTSVVALLIAALAGQVMGQSFPIPDLDAEPVSRKICMTCHGTYGQGNPVVGAPALAGLEPWYIKKQLVNFRESLRGVQKDYIPGYEMRAAVSGMTNSEIDLVLSYLGNWQVMPAEKTIEGDMARGQQLYTTCQACHGAEGEGNEALGAPGLAGRDDWYMLSQLKLYKSGYRGSHPEDITGRQMRAILQNLGSEQDMLDVIAYINTLD